MNRLLNIYYTLLEKLKYCYNDDTRGVLQLMQEDIHDKYMVIQTDISKFETKSISECMTFLINLSFYFGERNKLFNVHYNILKDIENTQTLYNWFVSPQFV